MTSSHETTNERETVTSRELPAPTSFDVSPRRSPTDGGHDINLSCDSDSESECELEVDHTAECELEVDHTGDSGKDERPSNTALCSAVCCADSEIYQPMDEGILARTERAYGSGTSHVLPSWYESYTWLHVCTTTLTLYCHYCRSAAKLGVRMQKADSAFIMEGFYTWKKATLSFKEHELSQAHQVAVAARTTRQTPISQQLERQLSGAQHNRRCSLV